MMFGRVVLNRFSEKEHVLASGHGLPFSLSFANGNGLASHSEIISHNQAFHHQMYLKSDNVRIFQLEVCERVIVD